MSKIPEIEEYTTTTFRLSLDLYEKLRKFAFDNRSSMNSVVVVALKKYLEEYSS